MTDPIGDLTDLDLPDLQKALEAYGEVNPPSTEEARESWNAITGGLAWIIEQQAPYIHRHLELPVILFATPEIVSLPPTMGNLANVIGTGDGGGLADFSAALVAELNRQGVNVHVVLPDYEKIFKARAKLRGEDYESLRAQSDGKTRRVHLVTDGLFEGAERVYGDPSSKLSLIDLRTANALQRGIIYGTFEDLKENHPNQKILVHCNDWMTGLVPAAAKIEGIYSLMTFHNIFTQLQWPEGLRKHSINIEPFWECLYYAQHPDTFGSFDENYENNKVDFLASGLHAADMINTVSPAFLEEIVRGYFDSKIIPDHIRAVIRARFEEGSAVGILNAPMETADPRIDPLIYQKFWYEDIAIQDIIGLKEGKLRNKTYFQREMGLKQDPEVPIFFWPSRMSMPQKGFELLLDLIPSLMDDYNMQIAVVANGEEELVKRIKQYQEEFPGRVSYAIFDRRLSQTGKAGSDFLMMPSLYEPCGTPQMEGPRYGTLPVVRRTGGLEDTVGQLSEDGEQGNGFVFEHYTNKGLAHGIQQAMCFYKKGEDFRLGVQRRVMRESFEKFNIENTASSYMELYEGILQRENPGLRLV